MVRRALINLGSPLLFEPGHQYLVLESNGDDKKVVVKVVVQRLSPKQEDVFAACGDSELGELEGKRLVHLDPDLLLEIEVEDFEEVLVLGLLENDNQSLELFDVTQEGRRGELLNRNRPYFFELLVRTQRQSPQLSVEGTESEVEDEESRAEERAVFPQSFSVHLFVHEDKI